MMDATPITLGQEFSAFSKQIENGIISLENSLKFILEIALGGTAVGTGLNTPDGYSKKVAEIIAKETNCPFTSAENKFEALSSNDSIAGCHGSLKKIAVALNKLIFLLGIAAGAIEDLRQNAMKNAMERVSMEFAALQN